LSSSQLGRTSNVIKQNIAEVAKDRC